MSSCHRQERFIEAAEKGLVCVVERKLSKWVYPLPLDHTVLCNSSDSLPQSDFRTQALLKAWKAPEDVSTKGEVVHSILSHCHHIPLSEDAYRELGFSTLHRHAWTGSPAIIVDAYFVDSTLVNGNASGGTTPLHIAALRGHLHIVRKLLSCENIQVDVVSDDGFTALHMAADGGHLEIVRLLLQSCSDAGFINSKDRILKRTALHYACRNGNAGVVRLLLDTEGVEIDAKDGYREYTPWLLAVASQGDKIETVKLLMERGAGSVTKCKAGARYLTDSLAGDKRYANPDYQMPMKRDLVHSFASRLAYPQWMLLRPKLLDSYYLDLFLWPVNVEAARRGKATTLDLAARANNTAVFCELLKQDFESHVYARLRWKEWLHSAFHYAVMYGSVDVFSMLLEDGRVDVMADSKGGKEHDNALHRVLSNVDEVVWSRWTGSEAMKAQYEKAFLCQMRVIMEIMCTQPKVFYFEKTVNTAQSLATLDRSAAPRSKKVSFSRWAEDVLKVFSMKEDYITFTQTISQEKASLQNAAGALLVGGTLLAGLAFSGFLQPPLLSGGRRSLNLFWVFNCLSFYFSVYNLHCSSKVLLPDSLNKIQIERLRAAVNLGSLALALAIAFATGAFITAGFANFTSTSKSLMFASTLFGICFLVPFIGIFIGKYYLDIVIDIIKETRYFLHRHYMVSLRRVARNLFIHVVLLGALGLIMAAIIMH